MMTLGLLFWLVYIIVLLFGGFLTYQPNQLRPLGVHAVYMILVGLLGWAEFGAAVHK